MFLNRYTQIGFLVAVVIVAQVTTHVTGTSYYLTQLTMAAYYTLVIIGLCLLMGYAGQISLGHAGFFALGGYVSAFLTTYNLSEYKHLSLVRLLDSVGFLAHRTGLYGGDVLHVEPWIACISAVLFTVGVAYALGGPILKLKGHYLAMATLGFGIIIYRIVLGTQFLGGADGISSVPPFELVPGIEVSGKLDARIENYYVAWGLLLLGMLSLLNLNNSRVGRALRAIHGAEDAANAMGVDTSRYKLKVFVLSAAFAAIAGVFMTHFTGGVGPGESSVMKSVRYVAIVAVGGMANLWGALIMGVLLTFLSLRGYFGSFDDAFFGTILIVIMLFAPGGLLRRENVQLISGLLSRKRSEEA